MPYDAPLCYGCMAELLVNAQVRMWQRMGMSPQDSIPMMRSLADSFGEMAERATRHRSGGLPKKLRELIEALGGEDNVKVIEL